MTTAEEDAPITAVLVTGPATTAEVAGPATTVPAAPANTAGAASAGATRALPGKLIQLYIILES